MSNYESKNKCFLSRAIKYLTLFRVYVIASCQWYLTSRFSIFAYRFASLAWWPASNRPSRALVPRALLGLSPQVMIVFAIYNQYNLRLQSSQRSFLLSPPFVKGDLPAGFLAGLGGFERVKEIPPNPPLPKGGIGG